jgi:ABC-type phosphate/phosphonate transport system substrate-binding protein
MGSTHRRLPILRFAVAAACVVSAFHAVAQEPVARVPLNVGFTVGMFAGVNVNDVKAAINVWAKTLLRTRGLELESDTQVYEGVEDLQRAVDGGRVSIVVMSLAQYHRLNRPGFGEMFVGGRRDRFQEEVVLLVRSGRFHRLAELKGHTLVVLEGTAHDMARAWFETRLFDEGLPAMTRHFGTVATAPKPAKAVLPVYFGQTDACLVDRNAYDVMVELNPQLGRELTILAESPPMVHAVMLFDRHFSPRFRRTVIDAMLDMYRSTRGHEALAVFRLDRIGEANPIDVAASLDILARGERQRRGGHQP